MMKKAKRQKNYKKKLKIYDNLKDLQIKLLFSFFFSFFKILNDNGIPSKQSKIKEKNKK